jgi:hypothetical protein
MKLYTLSSCANLDMCWGAVVRRIFYVALLLPLAPGCTLLPRTQEQGAVTISSFQRTIECEIAAVANDPAYSAYNLKSWNVKTALDMTIVDIVGADAGGTLTIPSGSGIPTVSPALSISNKHTSGAHVDFAISIPKAIERYGDDCKFGSDPSGTHIGLAAWIASTVDVIEPQNHGGLTYTTEFDVTASAGSKFGYVMTLANVNAGVGGSREGTHRLVVAMSQPIPQAGPQPVRVVGPVTIVSDGAQPARAGPDSNGQKARPVAKINRGQLISPALEDPNLNRLQQLQAPVRLAPGSVLR